MIDFQNDFKSNIAVSKLMKTLLRQVVCLISLDEPN